MEDLVRLDEDLVERDNMEDNLTRLGSEEMVEREERKLEKLLPASATLHNCLLLFLSKVSTNLQQYKTFLGWN